MSDNGWFERDNWADSWDASRQGMGVDLLAGQVIPAADAIERGAVRRFCEALEMDFPLFYDAELARQHGYRDILAPVSGISQAWVDAGTWRPGQDTCYPIADRDAAIVGDVGLRLNALEIDAPPTRASTQAWIEVEYFEPACVGDHLAVRAMRLVEVVPKQTSVGRGAFLTFENEVVNQRGELVAVVRRCSYRYEPWSG